MITEDRFSSVIFGQVVKGGSHLEDSSSKGCLSSSLIADEDSANFLPFLPHFADQALV